MAEELLMVVARNRLGVLAEITVMMAHRQVDLAAMTVRRDAACDTLYAVLTIRPETTPGGMDMLRKRLSRVVDIVRIVALDAGEVYLDDSVP